MTNYQREAKDFLKKHNAKMTISFKDCVFNPWNNDNDKYYHNVYRVRIDRNHKTWSFNFTDSIYNTNNNLRPSAYDVLACIVKYDIGTFEDFCSEFGYVIDTKDSLKIYKAVKKEYENVISIFGDCIVELAEIN